MYQPQVTRSSDSPLIEIQQLKEHIIQLNTQLEALKNLQEENIRLKEKLEVMQDVLRIKQGDS